MIWTTEREREFFRAAAWMLAWRLRVMGGRLDRPGEPPNDLAKDLAGMAEWAWEMQCICR
jgi:hypothetical protein